MFPTYSLYNDNEANSLEFYQRLSEFTSSVATDCPAENSTFIKEFLEFREKNKLLMAISYGEAYLEFLMIGIFIQNYGNRKIRMSRLTAPMLNYLHRARKKFPALKSIIDKLRGWLMYKALNGVSHEPLNPSKQYDAMIRWMQATYEYNEEIRKLGIWRQWLDTFAPVISMYILNLALSEASRFTKEAKRSFGRYTKNVESFRMDQKGVYKNREDFLFTLRNENEYFLNIFGAELLNRELKDSYRKTKNKVIVLPLCMRNLPESECKAVFNGKGRVCRQCNEQCNIGRITKAVDKKNVTTYIIPHSSEFSKFLNAWSYQDHTGLIGVGCALNLIRGGYEMQRLKIPSQCVFLDYSGCKKHWDVKGKGIPTNLNLSKLKKVI